MFFIKITKGPHTEQAKDATLTFTHPLFQKRKKTLTAVVVFIGAMQELFSYKSMPAMKRHNGPPCLPRVPTMDPAECNTTILITLPATPSCFIPTMINLSTPDCLHCNLKLRKHILGSTAIEKPKVATHIRKCYSNSSRVNLSWSHTWDAPPLHERYMTFKTVVNCGEHRMLSLVDTHPVLCTSPQ